MEPKTRRQQEEEFREMLRQDMENEIGPELKRPSSLTFISWLRSAGRRVRGTRVAAQIDGANATAAST